MAVDRALQLGDPGARPDRIHPRPLLSCTVTIDRNGEKKRFEKLQPREFPEEIPESTRKKAVTLCVPTN